MTKLLYFIFILCVLCASAVNPLYPAEDDDIDDLIDGLDKELKPVPVEEKIDVIDTLSKVADLMESAEDRLSSAGNWTPATGTDTAPAEKRQQEALDELNKLFDQIKNLQSEASKNLRKVIDSAVVIKPKGSGKQRKPQPQNQKLKPKPQPKDQQNNQGPAPRAYDAKGDLPDPYTPRKSDAKKWGNLPPKLRDEIIQSAQEEFLPEYQDRLSRYYKILAGEE